MQPHPRRTSGVQWQWSDSLQDYYYHDTQTNQYIIWNSHRRAADTPGQQQLHHRRDNSQTPRTIGSSRSAARGALPQLPQSRDSRSSYTTGGSMAQHTNAANQPASASHSGGTASSVRRPVLDSVQRYRLTKEIVETFLRETFQDAPPFNVQVEYQAALRWQNVAHLLLQAFIDNFTFTVPRKLTEVRLWP